MHVWDALLSDIFESKLPKFCLLSAGDECWERLQILLIPSVKQPLKLMQVRIRQVYISFIRPREMSNSLRNARNVQDFLSALRGSTRSHDLQVSQEWGHEFTSATLLVWPRLFSLLSYPLLPHATLPCTDLLPFSLPYEFVCTIQIIAKLSCVTEEVQRLCRVQLLVNCYHLATKSLTSLVTVTCGANTETY